MVYSLRGFTSERVWKLSERDLRRERSLMVPKNRVDFMPYWWSPGKAYEPQRVQILSGEGVWAHRTGSLELMGKDYFIIVLTEKNRIN